MVLGTRLTIQKKNISGREGSSQEWGLGRGGQAGAEPPPPPTRETVPGVCGVGAPLERVYG